jgi:hypothetical protein
MRLVQSAPYNACLLCVGTAVHACSATVAGVGLQAKFTMNVVLARVVSIHDLQEHVLPLHSTRGLLITRSFLRFSPNEPLIGS